MSVRVADERTHASIYPAGVASKRDELLTCSVAPAGLFSLVALFKACARRFESGTFSLVAHHPAVRVGKRRAVTGVAELSLVVAPTAGIQILLCDLAVGLFEVGLAVFRGHS